MDEIYDEKSSLSIVDLMMQSKWIAYGTVCSRREEDSDSYYSFKTKQALFGDLDNMNMVVIEPTCLKRTVRFGFRSQREVVAFSLKGGLELSGDDFVLPIIHDPINGECYIKIPDAVIKKNSLFQMISSSFSQEPKTDIQKSEKYSGYKFILFEEFKTNLEDLRRDI